MTALAAVLSFIVGAFVTAFAILRWWSWQTTKPEVARAMLKSLYRKAHPNWLQISKDDPARVCPCCGWSEKEGLAAGAEKCPGCTCGADTLNLKSRLRKMGGANGPSPHDVGCPARDAKVDSGT